MQLSIRAYNNAAASIQLGDAVEQESSGPARINVCVAADADRLRQGGDRLTNIRASGEAMNPRRVVGRD